MLIKDVVTQDAQVVFTSDVQLFWYPNDPRNFPLVRGYMFTSKAIENKVPSVKMLKNLRDSFRYGDENRHVIIATFGHGKSHLALALANFFGKSSDSQEVNALLDRIAHVSGQSEAQNLREFKQDRPPFLIVRMQGDKEGSLHQKFVHALEIAIAEHPGANGTPIPFWFDKAEIFLKGLSDEQRDKADAFLHEHGFDVATLLDRISPAKRDQSVYDLCVLSFTHLIGVPPNFGGEVSLQELVEWAADTFCEDSNPIAGGILVLFDEFSAFIHRYAQRTLKADTPLQDLLNGVANCHRKVVFVAFSQRDPVADAKDIYQHGGDKYDSLLKEIERLPNEKWHSLYSSLESVLNAYLKQADVIADIAETASSSFVSANNATIQLLKPRYDDNMGWGYEQVDQIMARGCFPLHPLTTGLFCSVELKQITNTRSVLGFVLYELKQRLDQSVLIDGKPNWIYPVALVDWFCEMLAEREYKEYEEAAAHAGPEIPEVQKAVLKSILLFGIGRLQLGRVGLNFGQAVSQLCGYSTKECDEALQALRSAGYVRFDESRKVYTFWPANAGATKIEEMVRKELQAKTLDGSHITAINSKESPWVASIEVTGVDWGHPQEWAAREILLPRRFFTASDIKRLAPCYQIDAARGFIDGVRGCVIRLIATEEEDIRYFREKADQFLKEALGNNPLPVILALPIEPTPHLCNNLLAYFLLKDWPNDKRTEVSQEAYSDKKKRVEKDIAEDLLRLRGLSELIVPEDYRSVVLAQDAHTKVESALRVCYQRAYQYSPKHYFTQYQITATSHRSAVALVCQNLAYNTLNNATQAIAQNRVAEELVKRFLRRNGSIGWGLVTETHYLTEPTNPHIKQGWDHLNANFPQGTTSTPIKNALIALLNPPFGYDPHQVALLFLAWYGYHKRDLTLTTNSGKVTIEEYLSFLKTARDFLIRICHVDPPLLTRTDPNVIEQEIRQMVDRVKAGTFTIAEAEQIQKTLRGYLKDDNTNPDLKKHIEAAHSLLETDIASAKKYKEESDAISFTMNAEVPLGKLLLVNNRISNLPTLGRVDESWPSPSHLNNQWNTKFEAAVTKECQRLATLKSLSDFSLNKKSLGELRGEIVGRITLVSLVDDALKSLQEAKSQLEAKQHDQAITAEVHAMQVDAPLMSLNRSLEKLKGYKPQSVGTKELIEAKQAALQKAVDGASLFINELSERLDAINSERSAQALQNEIQRRYNLYKDTPFQEQLDVASARCAQIQRCLADLNVLQLTTIQSPSDVQDLRSRLSSLLATQQEFLGESQTALFTNTQQEWDIKVADKQQEAEQWLTKIQGQVEQGNDLEIVKLTLSKPPAFLSDESRPTLAALQRLVEQKLDQENATRKLQEQDLPISTEVKAIQATQGLASLRASINRLTELAPTLPETIDLIKVKKTQLVEAIAAAIAHVSQLAAKADQILDEKAARQLDLEIQRVYVRYQDTPEQATLDNLSVRCKALEGFCRKHEQIKQKPFSLPEEAENQFAELATLQDTCSEFLNEAQVGLLHTTREAIEKRIGEKRVKAGQWIGDKERQVAVTGNPEVLLTQLETPPAFLTDELQAKLVEIREATQTRINEIREAQAHKEQDNPIVAAVNAIPIKGSLATLRTSLHQLETYQPKLPATKNLVTKKAEAISKSIKDMELEIPLFVVQLQEATTPKQVADIKNSLLRVQNLYADTPEEIEIAKIAAYSEQLGQCLSECIQIGQEHPVTPEALDKLQNRLLVLEAEQSVPLSPKQRAVFETARQVLASHAENKVKEAVVWWECCKKSAEQMNDPVELLAALASPSPFLPADYTADIETMRQQAQLKIDEDVIIRVIGEFKQISDKTKRMACLTALQALMQERED